MESLAGKIIKYYSRIGVASVEISGCLELGDIIHIKGHTTNFEQTVDSMQISHSQVSRVSKGDVAGIKVTDYVRKHDLVYRLKKGCSYQGAVVREKNKD
ncbi:MAG: translation elongation factor-like protein [Nitrospirota bacterium]